MEKRTTIASCRTIARYLRLAKDDIHKWQIQLKAVA